MVDKIVLLENNKKYVILDGKHLNNKYYYFALRLDDNEETTNTYLFFEEIKDNDNTYLVPVIDENMREALLTTFTVNYLDKVYDEV